VKVAGPASQPTLTGGLQWVEGRVGDVALDSAVMAVAPRDQGHDVSLQAMFHGGGSLDVHGAVPLSLDLDHPDPAALDHAGLALLVGGRVPLGVLAGTLPGVSDAQGDLQLDGEVRGSLLHPQPVVEVALEGGRLSLARYGVTWADLALDGALDGRRLLVRRLAATSEPWGRCGRIGKESHAASFSGDMAMDGLVPGAFRFEGSLDGFWLACTDDAELAVSGDAIAQGRLDDFGLVGDVRVIDGWLRPSQEVFAGDVNLGLDPRIRVDRPSYARGARTGEVARTPVPSLSSRAELDRTSISGRRYT
jgi:hypothetical protein